MKFIITGDIQEKHITPENRLGDFRQDIRNKRLEIVELAKSEGAVAILQPGDFWDISNPPLEFAAEVLRDWTGVNINKKEINETGPVKSLEHVPLIGIAGNHDLIGNNIVTLHRTMLGFMESMGMVTLVSKNNPLIYELPNGKTVAITGTNYHLAMDKPEHLNDYIVEEKMGDYHIHIVHGMLTDKELGKYIRHTQINNILHTKADLTICGHDHLGFGLKKIDGKLFLNAGSVSRLTNHDKEIARMPKVYILNIDNEISIEEYYLKSAKKGSEVLQKNIKQDSFLYTVSLEEFKESLHVSSNEKTDNIEQIIGEIAKVETVESELIEEIKNLLSMRMNENEQIQENVYIKCLELENFQSHKHTIIECSKGLNVFVGESRQGKTSAAIRATKWLLTNKPTGKRIIRTGEEYASVKAHLSNGLIIERITERKKNGKNGFNIGTANGQPVTLFNTVITETQYFNTKILPEIQKLIGYSTLKIDSDCEIDMNFLQQGSGWFLIGDHYSAPTRAKIIGSIYGAQHIDGVLRDVNKEIKSVKDKESLVQNNISSTKEKLAEFNYLEELKNTIEYLKVNYEKIESLKEKKASVERARLKHATIKERLKETEEECILLNGIASISSVYNMRDNLSKYISLKKHSEQLFMLKKRLAAIDYAMNTLIDTKEWKDSLMCLQDNIQQSASITKISTKINELVKSINSQSNILESLNGVNSRALLLNLVNNVSEKDSLLKNKEKLEQLATKKEKTVKALREINITVNRISAINQNDLEKVFNTQVQLSKVNKLINDKSGIELQIRELNKKIQDTDVELVKLKEEYSEHIQEIHICPTCERNLDSEELKIKVFNHLLEK